MAFCSWFLDPRSCTIVARDITKLLVPSDWEGRYTPEQYCVAMKNELSKLLRLDINTSPSDVCLHHLFFILVFMQLNNVKILCTISKLNFC